MPASLSKRGTIERLEVPPLNILPSSATEKQRIEFVRKHLDAMVSCGRRSLQHAWLVGRELDYIRKKRAELKGRQWHRFVQTEFKIGERQAFDLMRVFRSFPGLRSLPKGSGRSAERFWREVLAERKRRVPRRIGTISQLEKRGQFSRPI